ncbi:MAG: SDR family oxidoreductase [Rhodospirillaceae bacterium]
MSMRFRDSVVWITGASSGIGEALARAFGAEGAHVVLSARREDELHRVAATLQYDRPPMVLPLDVTDAAAVETAASAVLGRYGRVDILVNNAGLTQRARLVDTSLAVYRQVMEVNYFGPLMLTKAVLPSMISRGAGHVVAVSSVAGKYGSAMRSGYCGAKHAVQGLFDALRAEVEGAGIAVTVAVPGAVRTRVSINALTADGTPYDRMDPFLETGMSPEDCAARILDAVRARRREVLIATGAARRHVLLQRLSPALLSWTMRRRRPANASGRRGGRP